MKKLLLPLLVMFALVGCEEKTDMFGVKYADYPIAGKAYKHIVEVDRNDNYDVYTFDNKGRCNVDYYFNDTHEDGAGIYDYYYWMESDSIFISCGKDGEKRDFKYMRGKYFKDYIILDGWKMSLIK